MVEFVQLMIAQGSHAFHEGKDYCYEVFNAGLVHHHQIDHHQPSTVNNHHQPSTINLLWICCTGQSSGNMLFGIPSTLRQVPKEVAPSFAPERVGRAERSDHGSTSPHRSGRQVREVLGEWWWWSQGTRNIGTIYIYVKKQTVFS